MAYFWGKKCHIRQLTDVAWHLSPFSAIKESHVLKYHNLYWIARMPSSASRALIHGSLLCWLLGYQQLNGVVPSIGSPTMQTTCTHSCLLSAVWINWITYNANNMYTHMSVVRCLNQLDHLRCKQHVHTHVCCPLFESIGSPTMYTTCTHTCLLSVVWVRRLIARLCCLIA